MKNPIEDFLAEKLLIPQKKNTQQAQAQSKKSKKKKSLFSCCCFSVSTDEESDGKIIDNPINDQTHEGIRNSVHTNGKSDSNYLGNVNRSTNNPNNQSCSTFGEATVIIHGQQQNQHNSFSKPFRQSQETQEESTNQPDSSTSALKSKSSLYLKSHSSYIENDKAGLKFQDFPLHKSHSAENKSSMLSQKSNGTNDDDDDNRSNFLSKLQTQGCLGETHGELTWLKSGTVGSSGVLVKVLTKHLQIAKTSTNNDDGTIYLTRHIADRVAGLIVVENVCSEGENLLILARECGQLVSLSSNIIGLKAARMTLESAKLLQNVELIQARQLTALRGMLPAADVVIVRSDMLNPHAPILQNILIKSFDIAESVILVLPKHFDPAKLPLLLQQSNFSEKKFAVELQLVYLDSVFQQAIAFIGTISDVQKSEEINYFVEKLSANTGVETNNKVFKDKLRLLIVNLCDKMRLRGIALLIQDCEQSIVNGYPSEELNNASSNKKISSKKQTNQANTFTNETASNSSKTTLLSEFLERIINSRRQDRVQSSGSTTFEFDSSSPKRGYHGNSSDLALRQLVVEIFGILQSVKTRDNTLSKEQQYESSFSYSSQKLDFMEAAGANSAGRSLQKNKYNQSMLETATEASQTSAFSPRFTSKLKEFNSKRDHSKDEQNDDERNNQQYTGEDQYAYSNSNGIGLSPVDNGDDMENSQKAQYYSCSYDPNTLVNSESSESNSLRTGQIGNNQYSYSDYDDTSEQPYKQQLGGKGVLGRSKSKGNFNQSGWADGEYSRSVSRNLSSQQQQQLLKYIDDIQDGDFCLEQEEEDEDDNDENDNSEGIGGKRRKSKGFKEMNSYDQITKLKDKQKPNFYSRIR